MNKSQTTDHQVTVSVDWLNSHINDDNLVVIDGTWHLPNVERDPKAEYFEGHIPKAVFFDLEKQSNPITPKALMMPSAEQFGRQMGELGISHTDTIVIYDAAGLFSAARVWWMFWQFGAHRTYILDGGLPAWQKAGYALESGPFSLPPKTFNAKIDDALIIDLEAMKKAVANPEQTRVFDARGKARFSGTAPEPRPNVRNGHMPGAINMPYGTLLDDEKKLLPPASLQKIFENAGYDPNKATISTCGSGVTACIILLALARLGKTNVPLYDGSWSEWGAQPDTPVVCAE